MFMNNKLYMYMCVCVCKLLRFLSIFIVIDFTLYIDFREIIMCNTTVLSFLLVICVSMVTSHQRNEEEPHIHASAYGANDKASVKSSNR